MSGGRAIRLVLALALVGYSIAALLTQYQARARHQRVYDEVSKLRAPSAEEVRQLVGKAPANEEVRGTFLIEQYIFRTALGQEYNYFAVYGKSADPKQLLFHYKDRVPYNLGRPKPDLPKQLQQREDFPLDPFSNGGMPRQDPMAPLEQDPNGPPRPDRTRSRGPGANGPSKAEGRKRPARDDGEK